ncbi:LysR substrate-binding domain-containing protein [Cupriavidus sp. 8B]
MELKQLEAFVHVVELGSFTRAATILDTNQPTLSRLVRQLEVELRQTLLVRNGRGVLATDAGQVMLGHAKGMLLQAERARHDLRQLKGTVSGHFSIGLAPSFAKVATQELIRQFRQRFPDATISVAEGLSTYLMEWLMMGRIDAAVLYDTSLTALVEKRAVFEEELFLIGMGGSTGGQAPEQIRLKDIGRYPLVIPGRMHALRQIVEARAAEEGVKLAIALEVDAVGAILDLVCEGYGYAVLPINAPATDPLKRPFSVTRIAQPTLHTRLAIATSSQHTLSHLAMEAIGLIETAVLPLYTTDRNPGEMQPNEM